MSTLFGLFYRDGKLVSNELKLMYGGMKHFPHEKHAFPCKAIVDSGICSITT